MRKIKKSKLKSITVRLSLLDFAYLSNASRKANLSFSEFIRRCIKSARVNPHISGEKAKAIKGLVKVIQQKGEDQELVGHLREILTHII